MTLTKKESSILEALEARVPEGIEVVTVEITGSRTSPTLRIYLDKKGGICFDDLNEAQTWVDEVVEGLDPFAGAYVLEVSSPGIDRPLRTPTHFQRAVGSEALIKTEPIEGRSRFTGIITAADEQGITVEADGQAYAIAYEGIKRANIKGTVDFKR